MGMYNISYREELALQALHGLGQFMCKAELLDNEQLDTMITYINSPAFDTSEDSKEIIAGATTFLQSCKD